VYHPFRAGDQSRNHHGPGIGQSAPDRGESHSGDCPVPSALGSTGELRRQIQRPRCPPGRAGGWGESSADASAVPLPEGGGDTAGRKVDWHSKQCSFSLGQPIIWIVDGNRGIIHRICRVRIHSEVDQGHKPPENGHIIRLLSPPESTEMALVALGAFFFNYPVKQKTGCFGSFFTVMTASILASDNYTGRSRSTEQYARLEATRATQLHT